MLSSLTSFPDYGTNQEMVEAPSSHSVSKSSPASIYQLQCQGWEIGMWISYLDLYVSSLSMSEADSPPICANTFLFLTTVFKRVERWSKRYPLPEPVLSQLEKKRLRRQLFNILWQRVNTRGLSGETITGSHCCEAKGHFHV